MSRPPFPPADGPTLVTGASGLIGRALVRHLRDRGMPVRVLMRGTGDVAGGVDAVVGDLTEAGALTRGVRGARQVMHLAALKDHLADDAALDRVNVHASVALYEAAAAAGVQRFVHCSSVSAEPGGGSTAYGRSKIRAESALRAAVEAAGPRAPELVILRPGPVYCEDRPRLQQLVHWAMRWRLVAHLTPDTPVHLVSRENVVQAFECAATRGEPGRTYAICDAEPVPRSVLSGVLAAETGAWDLPLPVALVKAAGQALVRAETAWAGWRGRTPRLDAHLLHVLMRERRYDIAAARRELGYLPESTEVGFTRAVRRCRDAAPR